MIPTRETIAQLASECHDLTCCKDSSVFILYDDGKLCSTAGGDLFGTRSLKILRFGVDETFDGFPWEHSGQAACIVSREDADKITSLIDQFMDPEGLDAHSRRQLEQYKQLKRMCFDGSVGHVLKTMDELINCFAQYIEHGEVKRIPPNLFCALGGYGDDDEVDQAEASTPEDMLEWFKKTAKSFPAKMRELREIVIRDSTE